LRAGAADRLESSASVNRLISIVYILGRVLNYGRPE
jgi:hypothetical protein